MRSRTAIDLVSIIEIAGWPIYEAVIASAVIVLLVARIWSIERSHQRIRAVLEKRVSQRTRDLEKAFVLTEHVVNAVSEAILVVDARGQAVLLNPAARALLGIGQRGDDTKQVCRHFDARHPELHERIRAQIEGSTAHETFNVDVDVAGRRRVLEVSATPLNGEASGRVYVIRDITEALTFLEMKSRFVSIVSHEIRTPLTALAGSLDLLDAGALGAVPPRAADLISVARSSTDRLVRLVNDVLDLDRLESNHITLSRTRCQVDDLFAETLRTLQTLAAEHGVRLLAESSVDSIDVDHDRVVQVLLNLVQNAIKFSPPDSTILVAAHRRGDDVVITVDDEGRGIPTVELERIFDPFTQVETADDRRGSGTGLGLTISRGIVHRHGGRIWAENRTPFGTRFVVTLPIDSSIPDPRKVAS